MSARSVRCILAPIHGNHKSVVYLYGAEMDEDFVEHVLITAAKAVISDVTEIEVLHAQVNNGLPKNKIGLVGRMKSNFTVITRYLSDVEFKAAF